MDLQIRVQAVLQWRSLHILHVSLTTDNSERLRIIHSASGTRNTSAADNNTWINVTTGHTRTTLVDLPGTVVLNYDVTGPCDLVTCTAVSVYVTDSGETLLITQQW